MKLLLSLIVYFTIIQAQTMNWFGFKVNLDLISNRTDSLNININKIKAGSWRWSVEKAQSRFIFTDVSILDPHVREDAQAIIDRSNLYQNSFTMTFRSGSNVVESQLNWDNSNVTGTFKTLINSVTNIHAIDTTFKQIIPRMTLIALLPYIDFTTIDQELDLSLYSKESHYVFPVKLSVHPKQVVQTKSGVYHTTRIDILKAGNQGVSNRFYIKEKHPRHIVKVDVLGQNMEIDWVGQID